MSTAPTELRTGETATLAAANRAGGMALVFAGRLDAAGVAPIWTPALKAASTAKQRMLLFDLSAVSVCDTAGATLLIAAEQALGRPVQLEGALFGSMTLLENIMLPLEAYTGLTPEARVSVARTRLGLVGLAASAGLLPAEISGGMARRAGIARAHSIRHSCFSTSREPASIRSLRPASTSSFSSCAMRSASPSSSSPTSFPRS